MRRRFLGGIKEKNNIIYYTSTDNLIIVPHMNNFGTIMINNKMSNSIGIMTFLSDITTIGNYTFYGREKLKSITIPNSVTSIGSNAFRNCFNLTTITIPDSVTSIGNFAFSWCTSLTSVTIPDGVTSIDNSAFYECSILASVTIGDSVTSIGNYAFSDCLGLTSVYCKPTTPPALNGSSVFYNNGSGRKIYVPYQSLNAYKTAQYWSEYASDIIGYDFENDTVVGGGSLITFTVNGVEHQAEEGMTWEEWCDSEYNTYGFWCSGNQIIFIGIIIHGQTPSDVICNGCAYRA